MKNGGTAECGGGFLFSESEGTYLHIFRGRATDQNVVNSPSCDKSRCGRACRQGLEV